MPSPFARPPLTAPIGRGGGAGPLMASPRDQMATNSTAGKGPGLSLHEGPMSPQASKVPYTPKTAPLNRRKLAAGRAGGLFHPETPAGGGERGGGGGGLASGAGRMKPASAKHARRRGAWGEGGLPEVGAGAGIGDENAAAVGGIVAYHNRGGGGCGEEELGPTSPPSSKALIEHKSPQLMPLKGATHTHTHTAFHAQHATSQRLLTKTQSGVDGLCSADGEGDEGNVEGGRRRSLEMQREGGRRDTPGKRMAKGGLGSGAPLSVSPVRRSGNDMENGNAGFAVVGSGGRYPALSPQKNGDCVGGALGGGPGGTGTGMVAIGGISASGVSPRSSFAVSLSLAVQDVSVSYASIHPSMNRFMNACMHTQASRRLHAQRKEALMKEAQLRSGAASASSVSTSMTSVGSPVSKWGVENEEGGVCTRGGDGDGEGHAMGGKIVGHRILDGKRHGAGESGESPAIGVGEWSPQRRPRADRALMSFEKLSVEVPVTPGLPFGAAGTITSPLQLAPVETDAMRYV